MDPITGGVLIGSSVIGAGGSLLGANKASKASASAMDSQRRLMEQDLAFRNKLFDYERSLTEPARRKLLRMSMSDQPLFYDQTASGIRKNYATAMRGMQGLGYNSGLQQSLMQGARLNLASDLGGAYASGMRDRLNMLSGVAGSDKSLQAGMNVSGGYGQMAGMYGNQAAQYGQAAAQGWQNFGNNLSGLAYGLASMYGKPGANTVVPVQTLGQTAVPDSLIYQQNGLSTEFPKYTTGINPSQLGVGLSYGVTMSPRFGSYSAWGVK